MNFDAARLANPAIARLKAYDPGHDLPALRRRFGSVLAELGSNENPLGPSPRALAAARDALAACHRYPDPNCGALRAALAEHLAVPMDTLCIGNGSHELLILLAQCFAVPGQKVLYSQYGFAVFALAAAAAGATGLAVPALPSDHNRSPFGHDLDAIAAAVTDDTRLVYLANPNNPTGTWFEDAELSRFLRTVPEQVLVIVDEAYHEYVDAPELSSALRFRDAHPQLVVTRTFSKAFGLAGLRVGCAVSHPSVAAVIERLRESFNVNAAAQAAAVAALADQEHLRRVHQENARGRIALSAALADRGIRVMPSQANFVLAELGPESLSVERRLCQLGVVVRPMGGYGLPHTLRISVGDDREIARLIECLP